MQSLMLRALIVALGTLAGSLSLPETPARADALRAPAASYGEMGARRGWTLFSAGTTGVLGGIAAGPTGNAMWAADGYDDALLEIAVSGSPLVSWPLTVTVNGGSKAFSPRKLVFGRDGRLYVNGCTSHPAVCNLITIVTTGGQVIGSYATPSGDTPDGGLVLGPDGNVWFNETHHVGKITPSGKITEYVYQTPAGNSRQDAIAVGPDHNIWFTYNVQYNVSGSDAMLGKVDPGTGQIVLYDAGFLCNITLAIVPLDNRVYYLYLSIGSSGSYPFLQEMTTGGLPGPPRSPPVQASANMVLAPDARLWFPSCPDAESASGGCYFGSGTPPGFGTFYPSTHAFANVAGPPTFGGVFGDAAMGPNHYLWTTMGGFSSSYPSSFVRYGPIS